VFYEVWAWVIFAIKQNSFREVRMSMEFLFVDESGDNGFSEGSTNTFTLAGIAIESNKWKEYLWKI
jgi:hypothetical protein